ncbi:MAG: UPF0175 family protein [Firmicutes bacterium]|nr:UPF0175 family protein [Bacillota bacterium]
MSLVVEIPREVVAALRLPPAEAEGELRKELALALYRRAALPLGKARMLAGMTRREFEELLGQRRIDRHYGPEELEDDLSYARSGR